MLARQQFGRSRAGRDGRRQPYDLDALAAASGLDAARLLPRLLDLELERPGAPARRRPFYAPV